MDEKVMDPIPNGKMEKKSTASSVSSGSSSPLILIKSDKKVQSRYLSPHTSSCHDFCKYGKKHDSESSSQNFRKFLKDKRKLARVGDQQNQVLIVAQEKKTELVIKPKTTSNIERGISDKTKAIKVVNIKTTRKKIYSLLDSEQNKERSLTVIKKTMKSSSKKPISPLKPKVPEKKVPNLEAKHRNIKRKDHLPPKQVDIVIKPALALKTKAPLIRSISRIKNEDKMMSNRTSQVGDSKTLKSPITSSSSKYLRNIVGDRKILKSTLISNTAKTRQDNVSSFQPIKLRSVEQRTSNIEEEEKSEKVNPESPSENFEFDPNSKIEESEYETSEGSDEEFEHDDKIDGLKERYRRNAAAQAEVNNTSTPPFKMKFRRGKIVNPRSESNGARRLWFNVGWKANENPNNNVILETKSFIKKIDDTNLDSNDPDSEVQNVVLKHQDVAEKKDSQSLFNHVIEETASKLVETRKSKVKALVGAFETVISLQ